MINPTHLLALVAFPLSLLGGLTDASAAPSAASCSGATAFPASGVPPVVRKVEEGKEKCEHVEFKTRDKQLIHARFYGPRKKGRAPAVLLVHGAGGVGETLDKLAKNLQRKGFAVLVPDLRGHGASVSPTCNWNKDNDKEVRTRTWSFAVRDLEASTSYLRNLKNVHNSNLSIVGVGAGALLATRYAVQDENARAVALIAPNADAYGFHILSDLNDLGGLPVLIMSESKERKDNVRIADASAKSNDGIEFITVKSLKPKKGGDFFTDKRLSSEITKFLAKQAMPKR